MPAPEGMKNMPVWYYLQVTFAAWLIKKNSLLLIILEGE
jgi:hypothetical protein